MPSTYTSLNFHIVFSTKNRVPSLHELWQTRMHDYIGGTINSLGGQSLGVGGISDHIHVLAGLKPTHCLADFVRDLKRSSSTWIKENFPLPDFAWQEGYSAFTVSSSICDRVQGYIRNQANHHRSVSLMEELISMLNAAEIRYDAKYLN